jgi:hypothetical protein
MRIAQLLVVITAAVSLGIASASAQLPGGNQAGLNAAMLKLFGDVSSFTSKADVRMQEKGAKEPLTMTVDFAMLDGKVRMDLDIGAVKSKQIPAESLASFKAAGLDKIGTIVRPDRKLALLIYPSVKSYVEMPMSKEEAADMDRKFTLQKTRLGRESIDGHPCEKNKVVVAGDNGAKHEAIVWYADDMKNFPLQMQMDQQQVTVVMRYRDVKLVRPDAKQFEAPATFTKYASNEELMQSAMLKMLGGK